MEMNENDAMMFKVTTFDFAKKILADKGWIAEDEALDRFMECEDGEWLRKHITDDNYPVFLAIVQVFLKWEGVKLRDDADAYLQSLNKH